MATIPPLPGIKRIATEEAWAPTQLLDAWRKLLASKSFDDPGFQSLWGFFLNQNVGYTNTIIDRLTDLGPGRLNAMDACGIDMQLLLMTAPGVQVFEKEDALAIAKDANDEAAAACRKYPDRFAALAVVPPQDPKAAAIEMQRAINTLGLKGIVINSHTKGEYLDDRKFWPIFEAAEALDAAIYIHPQSPPPNMSAEFIKRNVYVTTSGMGWEPAIKFCLDTMGEDHVMYAMDYPFQYMPEEVLVHDKLRLGKERLKKLYQTNAERIFHL